MTYFLVRERTVSRANLSASGAGLASSNLVIPTNIYKERPSKGRSFLLSWGRLFPPGFLSHAPIIWLNLISLQYIIIFLLYRTFTSWESINLDTNYGDHMENQLQNSGQYFDTLINLFVVWGPKLAGAILALFIGLWVANMVAGGLSRRMEKSEVDPSLRPFMTSLVSTLLKVLVLVSVLGMVGIQMTSFIAILGAAGLAVGMALSGTLQNFAGGVMILIFRPFKVGDFIDAQGYTGTVNAIQIFNTILKTPDNKTVVIPNGGLSTSSMVNYSTEPTRRVDWTFGIAYGDDIDKAKEVLTILLMSNEKVLKDPAPFVELGELADSSVNFTVRAWVNAADYWAVHFYMLEQVYRKFAEEGLNIPFPQMDVHLDKTA